MSLIEELSCGKISRGIESSNLSKRRSKRTTALKC
jgi:hypothetical protein